MEGATCTASQRTTAVKFVEQIGCRPCLGPSVRYVELIYKSHLTIATFSPQRPSTTAASYSAMKQPPIGRLQAIANPRKSARKSVLHPNMGREKCGCRSPLRMTGSLTAHKLARMRNLHVLQSKGPPSYPSLYLRHPTSHGRLSGGTGIPTPIVSLRKSLGDVRKCVSSIQALPDLERHYRRLRARSSISSLAFPLSSLKHAAYKHHSPIIPQPLREPCVYPGKKEMRCSSDSKAEEGWDLS